MARHFFALLLLSVLGLGLLAGPHPCKMSHAERASQPATCHESANSAQDHSEALASAPAQADGDQDCCDTACRHACHLLAVREVKPEAFAAVPLSQAVAELPAGTLPPLIHRIEHVPLA